MGRNNRENIPEQVELVMASHFSDIGFAFENNEEYRQFLGTALNQAETHRLPLGQAALYQPADGIQYWFPLNEKNEPLDYSFHFASGKKKDIRVIECIQPEPGEMSGLYRCEVDLVEKDGYPVPEVPINLYLPVAGLMGKLTSGAQYKAQIACFAEDIKVYENQRVFDLVIESGETKLALEHFIPTGTFRHEGDQDFEQSPHSMLGGMVQTSRRLVNPVTSFEYDHLQITSMGMEYDILVDPEMYSVLPKPGAIIHGMFWMSALVWADQSEQSSRSSTGSKADLKRRSGKVDAMIQIIGKHQGKPSLLLLSFVWSLDVMYRQTTKK